MQTCVCVCARTSTFALRAGPPSNSPPLGVLIFALPLPSPRKACTSPGPVHSHVAPHMAQRRCRHSVPDKASVPQQGIRTKTRHQHETHVLHRCTCHTAAHAALRHLLHHPDRHAHQPSRRRPHQHSRHMRRLTVQLTAAACAARACTRQRKGVAAAHML